jgi:hypothetical protein
MEAGLPASVHRHLTDLRSGGRRDAHDADDDVDVDVDGDDVADEEDMVDGVDDVRVRQCSEPGCTTVLSRYNATAWCGVHHRRDWRATREPRRRSA